MAQHPREVFFEPLEPRTLLSADLTGVFSDALPAINQVVPGAQLQVPVIITNDGDAAAVGNIRLELFLSLDNAFSGIDRLVTTLDNQAVNLAPDQSQQFTFDVTIPDQLPAGTGFLIGRITVLGGSIPGENAGNNVINENESGDPVTGTVGKPGKLTLNFTEDDGTVVTLTLTGNGAMQVVEDEDTGEADLFITGTDAKSKLTVKTKSGDGRAVVRNVVVGNPDDPEDRTHIGQISAPTIDLAGDFTITGAIAKLTLGDVDADHQITIGPGANANQAVAMVFRNIVDLVIDSDIGISKFTATTWTNGGDNDDQIIAPWVGKVTIKQDFEAGMLLSGLSAPAQTLASMKVGGDFGSDDDGDAAVFNITGNVGKIDASKGVVEGFELLALGDVKDIKLGRVDQAEITANGIAKLAAAQWTAGSILANTIGSLTTKANASLAANGDWRANVSLLGSLNPAFPITLKTAKIAGSVINATFNIQSGNVSSFSAGLMLNSTLRLGLSNTLDDDDLPVDADQFDADAGALAKFTITGLKGAPALNPSFINSFITARTIGKMSLKIVQTNNGDVPFGFAATNIASITARNPAAAKFPKLSKLINQATVDTLLGAFDLNDLVIRIVD